MANINYKGPDRSELRRQKWLEQGLLIFGAGMIAIILGISITSHFYIFGKILSGMGMLICIVGVSIIIVSDS